MGYEEALYDLTRTFCSSCYRQRGRERKRGGIQFSIDVISMKLLVRQMSEAREINCRLVHTEIKLIVMI